MSLDPSTIRPFLHNVPIPEMVSEFSKYMVNMGVAHSTPGGYTLMGALGFDPMKMTDHDIKVHCATQFGDDPVQAAACIDGLVKTRGQESCKTVNGITSCTKILATEIHELAPPPGFAPGMQEECRTSASGGRECRGKTGEWVTVNQERREEVKGSDVLSESVGAKIGKMASGYCAEGSVCGTPMYGRPLWVWILALLVILLALQGIQRR